ncbi:hypothetical protein JL09_g6117 [Pichia kudriavzevii]|uniref:Uncharacterized protein n=1 Tax=Pichia kudriavzevii TaxID=4909 RepID=A0A099NRQ1_PICKU|nr:hypothetical protein JL09_g6117 [Pichia kudriavzevii]
MLFGVVDVDGMLFGVVDVDGMLFGVVDVDGGVLFVCNLAFCHDPLNGNTPIVL